MVQINSHVMIEVMVGTGKRHFLIIVIKIWYLFVNILAYAILDEN